MASTNLSRFVRRHAQSVFCGSWRHVLSKQSSKTSKFLFSALSTESSSLLGLEKENGFGIITMKAKPVNALDQEMFTQLCNAIDELESDKSCQGMILTSILPKIFCAGLDITEFFKEKEQLSKFWHLFQEIWLKLYGSRLATIAAINGASPAGGCLLAIACDYRIMADGFVIGPNETRLGIVAPPWFQDTLVNTVGLRHTEHLLGLGQLLKSKQALEIGLVDCVVPQDEVMDTAKTELNKWLAIPGAARTTTKIMLRNPTLEKLRKDREADAKLFLDFCMKDSTQKLIASYLEKLGKR